MIHRLVTVDGPAGVGKTTLGRRLATELALPLIDTGLFYRGLMVAAVRAGIGPDDRDGLVRLAATTRLEVETDPDAPGYVRVNGEDAGDELRHPSNARLLSTMSQLPEVRLALMAPQRAAAASGGIAVGRDCGTVIYPDAPLKLYLEASTEERVRRRGAELDDDGGGAADVEVRDRLDAPSLRPAADAHLLDTGRLDADATFAEALRLCRAAAII